MGKSSTRTTPIYGENESFPKRLEYQGEKCYGEGGGRGVHVWERM